MLIVKKDGKEIYRLTDPCELYVDDEGDIIVRSTLDNNDTLTWLIEHGVDVSESVSEFERTNLEEIFKL